MDWGTRMESRPLIFSSALLIFGTACNGTVLAVCNIIGLLLSSGLCGGQQLDLRTLQKSLTCAQTNRSQLEAHLFGSSLVLYSAVLCKYF